MASFSSPSVCVSLRRLRTTSVTGGWQHGKGTRQPKHGFTPECRDMAQKHGFLYRTFRSNAQSDDNTKIASPPHENYTSPKTSESSIFNNTTLTASVYFIAIFASLFEGLLRAYFFFRMTTRSSTTLHDQMYGAVTRSPIRFFDTNPKGAF